jgi:NADH-quinone oxidoreductase subunit N
MATIYGYEPIMLLGILPELGLVLLGALVLILDLSWKGEQRRKIAWVVFTGLLIVGGVAAYISNPGVALQQASSQNVLIFNGMLRWDLMSWTMTLVFFFGGAITVLLAKDYDTLGKEGEFYLLLLTSMLGMCLMAGAADLIMLFLAIETTSIPLYVLAGFFKKDEASAEAGFKYLLFGAATSAVMLYGFSLLYGFSGTTQLYQIAASMQQNFGVSTWVQFALVLLVMVGFGFKIAAVPLHFWAPDVYQGAPTPVAGFLSTASKAAGFAVLMRFLPTVFSYSPQGSTIGISKLWSILIAVLAVASMLFGNLQAMRQHNIKRLLAYSSIAQAGYILIGVASIVSYLGYTGVVVYLMAYMVTNLAAFGIISIVEREVKSDEISDLSGLSRRSSGLALGLLAAFLSLAGIPPFAGFVGKVFLFSSAVMGLEYWWLAALVVIGVLNSILALYYYLRVVKIIYQGESASTEKIPVTNSMRIAVVVCVAGILAVGVFFTPLFDNALKAAYYLFQ